MTLGIHFAGKACARSLSLNRSRSLRMIYSGDRVPMVSNQAVLFSIFLVILSVQYYLIIINVVISNSGICLGAAWIVWTALQRVARHAVHRYACAEPTWVPRLADRVEDSRPVGPVTDVASPVQHQKISCRPGHRTLHITRRRRFFLHCRHFPAPPYFREKSTMELDWDRLNAIFQPRQDILDGIKRCAGE